MQIYCNKSCTKRSMSEILKGLPGSKMSVFTEKNNLKDNFTKITHQNEKHYQ